MAGRRQAAAKGMASAANAPKPRVAMQLGELHGETERTTAVKLAASSSGRPLDAATRAEMEGHFGHDLGNIRVHTDEPAAEAAALLGAEAFTFGEHIFFAEGAYRADDGGRELLAHELAHTLQQAAPATIDTAPVVANAGATQEAHADVTANALLDGTPGSGTFEVSRTPPAIARRAARPGVKGRMKLPEPAEPLGPGQLLERLATIVVAHFRNDPTDEAGGVQQHLGRLPERVRGDVIDRVHARLSESEKPALEPVVEQDAGAQIPERAAGEQEKKSPEETGKPSDGAAAEAAPTTEPSEDGATTRESPPAAEADEATPAAAERAEEQPALPPTAAGEAAAADDEAAEVDKAPKLPRMAEAEEAKPEASPETAPKAAGAAGAGEAVCAVASMAGGGASVAADPGAAAGGGAGADPVGPALGGAAEPATAQAPQAASSAGGPLGDAAPTNDAPSQLQQQSDDAHAEAGDADATAEELASTDVATKDEKDQASGAEGATAEPAAAGQATSGGGSPDEPPVAEAVEPPAETPGAELEPPEAGAVPEGGAAEAPAVPAADSERTGDAAPSPAPAAQAPPESNEGAEATPPVEDPAKIAGADETGEAESASDSPGDATTASPAEAPAESPAVSDAAEVSAPGAESPAGAEASSADPAVAQPAAAGGESSAGATADFSADLADAGGPVVVEAGGGGGGAGGGGGGGGGGGAAIEEKPPPAVPDVSAAAPAAAMGAIVNLPPAQLNVALGAVSSAATRAVGEERQQLASNPPSVERPSGAPAQHPPAANPQALAAGIPNTKAGKVEQLPQAAAVPVLAPAPPPELAPAPPPAPTRVAGETPISAEDAARVQASVDNLPTTDPELEVTAGATPELALEGDADLSQTTRQRTKLDASVGEAQVQGAKDAAQNLGEDKVYPDTPAETLKAEIPASGGEGTPAAAVAGGGDSGGGDVDDETASIVADAKKGDEIRASVGEQSAEMEAKKDEHDRESAEERDKTQGKIDEEVQKSADEQEAERADVAQKVAKHRKDWTKEQQDAVDGGSKEADAAETDAETQVAERKSSAKTDAQKHIDDGNRDVNDARTTAEKKAQSEKSKAKSETSSGGFFSWLGNQVKSFFDGIKKSIHAAFDLARKAVKAAIKKCQELATAVIERARKAVVDLIHKAGDLLIAIGDQVLAAFPEARDKFRKLITEGVQAAEDTVNKLAEGLRKTIVEALDALGKALDAFLGLLEKAYMMAVDAVAKVVQGAIKFAKAVAQAFAAFAALIKDVAADPGGWLRNLGVSVLDGIKNHLVKAFKTAIRQWFDETVEQVLGIGKVIIQVLKKGGIPWAKIGSMAWEALKTAIPVMLIELLIEKLVSMIVPAAGAVLAIIQGLQAAWGAIQRIIAAFELFFAFLKAVRGGNAGPQFATAVAAAAIVVIQFVAFWLLRKLMKPAAKIGQKLKAIASKIMASLKKVAKVVMKGVKAVARAAKKGAKAAAGALKKGAKAVGKALVKGAKAVGRVIKKIGKKLANTKVGKALIKAAKKIRAKVKEWKDKAKKKWEAWKAKRKKKDKTKDKQARLEKAVAAIRPPIKRWGEKSVSHLWLKARLALWKLRYRLTSLSIGGDGAIVAVINPRARVHQMIRGGNPELMAALRKAVAEVRRDPRMIEMTEHLQGEMRRRKQPGETLDIALPADGGVFAMSGIKGRLQSTTYGMAGGDASVVQVWGGSPSHSFVVGPGRYANFAGELAARGLKERDLRTGVATLLSGGNLSGRLAQQRNFLASSTVLLGGVEAMRNPATPAILAAQLETSVRRRGSLVGDSPNEPVGAIRANKEINAALKVPGTKDPKTLGKLDTIQTIIDREVAIARAFVVTKLGADGRDYDNPEVFEKFVQKQLVAALIAAIRTRYGISS